MVQSILSQIATVAMIFPRFCSGCPLTETVLLGNVALHTDKKLIWDSQKLEFTNDAEANRYSRHDYREGWSL